MQAQKLYLVTGTIEKTWYMSDAPEITHEMLIVWAHTVDEADSKFCHHFESRTLEYSVYYTTSNVVAREALA